MYYSKMIKLKLLLLPAILCASLCYAQFGAYKYKRPLTNISGEWNKLVLPNEIYAKAQSSFSDIRIITVKEDKDTVEVPYIIKIAKGINSTENIAFTKINDVSNPSGYFTTFETNAERVIDAIDLKFEQDNFDWRVALQGSNDGTNWFNILKDYRIISIRKAEANYSFTKLVFAPCKYKYFRTNILADEAPKLLNAVISADKIAGDIFVSYPLQHLTTKTLKEQNKTEINFSFDNAVPICSIKILATNTGDYYRAVRIENLIDSFKNQTNEWVYNYTNIFNGILSSVDTSAFYFESTIAKKWRITIENANNAPLNISGVSAKGYEYSLTAKFSEKGNSWLLYGNTKATMPEYDIVHFSNKIPENLNQISAGKEESILQPTIAKAEPLFKKKIWLWAVLIFAVGIMAYFANNLLRKAS